MPERVRHLKCELMPDKLDANPTKTVGGEAHHLALLDAIDQGFCIIELLFKGTRAVDYRFVAVNSAFEAQTGLRDPVGKCASELVPELEPFWFETYGRVALTGEAKRFEDHAEAMSRWFDLYAFRVGEPEARQVAVLFKDVTRQRLADRALEEANEALETKVLERTREVQELAAQLTVAEAREQARLARVLHDDLQQQLYTAGFALRELQKHLPEGDEAAAEKLAEVRARVSESLAISRGVTAQLSPPVLQHGGLVEMLSWLGSDMDARYGLEVSVTTQGISGDVIIADEAARVLLFNLARELLFNVVKHAGVDEAAVTLAQDEDNFVLTVVDAGKGFDPLGLGRAGVGLSGVRQRLELFGGTLELSSSPGDGTRVAIVLPSERLSLG